jgi:hypothetical protein
VVPLALVLDEVFARFTGLHLTQRINAITARAPTCGRSTPPRCTRSTPSPRTAGKQLIAEINVPAEHPRWAWWAPGDATRYHATLINAAPSATMVGTVLGGTPDADR